MAKIIWSPLAIENLSEIKEYISKDSEKNALNFIGKLLNYPTKLLSFPNLGRDIPGCDSINAKEIFYSNYRLAYRTVGENIEVITIHHGSKISIYPSP